MVATKISINFPGCVHVNLGCNQTPPLWHVLFRSGHFKVINVSHQQQLQLWMQKYRRPPFRVWHDEFDNQQHCFTVLFPRPPESGCPERAILRNTIGRMYLPTHSRGHRSIGSSTQVSTALRSGHMPEHNRFVGQCDQVGIHTRLRPCRPPWYRVTIPTPRRVPHQHSHLLRCT